VVEHRQLGEGLRGLLGGLLSPALDDPRAFYEAGYTKPDAAEAERLGGWRAHVRGLRARPERAPAAEALRLGRVGLRVARLVEGARVVQDGTQETAEKPSDTFAQLTTFHHASR